MNPLSDLAGRLRVIPGAPVPHNLISTRQDWASRMGQGQRADQLPGLMASLFSLCGQSHRLCSNMAVAAALGRELDEPVAKRLGLETATEHVRRMGLDWPRLLRPQRAQPGADEDLAAQANASLLQCPLLQRVPAGERLRDPWQGMAAWLATQLFHMPAQDWLTAWDRDGVLWLRHWSQAHTGWMPRLIQSAMTLEMDLPLTAENALRPHGDAAQLRDWACTWAEVPHFVSKPQWRGSCAHTGTWSRAQLPAPLKYTTGTLLGSRMAELVRLTLSEAGGGASGPPVLAFGALNLGDKHGMAWVEMARGLLVHQLALDGQHDPHGVRVCRVLAPTEWNFHPQGPVAQVVGAFPRHNGAAKAAHIGVLMAAFDPCVPYEVEDVNGCLEKDHPGA